MRINRFLASGVHGYLSFDVRFYPDLTLLTGINGSGKTTVVHGISALVSPSLLTLANTIYDRMEVEVVHEQNAITIWSTRDESEIVLGVSDSEGPLKIPVLPREAFDAVPTYRVREERI